MCLNITMLSRSIFLLLATFASNIAWISCRSYSFPMCPPDHWKIPGGKITTTGTTHYYLVCKEGYTQPMLANRRKKFTCNAERQDSLPRFCIQSIYAAVVLEYGLVVNIQNGANNVSDICSHAKLLKRLKKYHLLPVTQQHWQHVDERHLESTEVRIARCENVGNKVSLLVIRLMNVPRGNGTSGEVADYYNFIVAESFKQLKKLIAKEGFKFMTLPTPKPPPTPEPPQTALSLQKPGDKAQDDHDWEWGENYVDGGSTNKTAGGGFLHTDNDVHFLDLDDRGGGKEVDVGFNVGNSSRRSRRAINRRGVKVDDVFKGLYKTAAGGAKPVGYSCPAHLELKADGKQYLCVGCGKGWFLTKLKGEKERQCYPCGPGFYNDLETATECKPCPLKYSSAPWDAASVDECFKLSADEHETKKWTLIGYLQPFVFFSLISILVAFVSKISIGTTTYKTAPPVPRKSVVRYADQQ